MNAQIVLTTPCRAIWDPKLVGIVEFHGDPNGHPLVALECPRSRIVLESSRCIPPQWRRPQIVDAIHQRVQVEDGIAEAPCVRQTTVIGALNTLARPELQQPEFNIQSRWHEDGYG